MPHTLETVIRMLLDVKREEKTVAFQLPDTSIEGLVDLQWTLRYYKSFSLDGVRLYSKIHLKDFLFAKIKCQLIDLNQLLQLEPLIMGFYYKTK